MTAPTHARCNVLPVGMAALAWVFKKTFFRLRLSQLMTEHNDLY